MPKNSAQNNDGAMARISSPLALYQSKIEQDVVEDDPQQRRALAALERLHGELTAPRGWAVKMRARLLGRPLQARGVYLYGAVGRGKSMVMDLFYASLPQNYPKRRVHFHEFMLGVHEMMHAARQNRAGAGDALPRYARALARNVRVLCFDEFHVTDVADAMILGRLFTALFAANVAVVATSNWPPDRLYEGGLQRDRFLPFIDLVKARMEVVALTGGVDYRLKALTDNGVYFWPLGMQSQIRADALFAQLTDHAAPYSETVAVKGRVISVKCAAKGVARFGFADLCEKPLGAGDYLALAARYHTIFLEDVPALGDAQRNEAKRLMILVDTLYEARRKLVVSAQQPTEKLYSGGDHAYEFERTVSRLMEMQGTSYLAGSDGS